MLYSTILPVLVFLFQATFSGVYAKCCLSDAGGDCGDNSAGTPCCGYKPCNGFCCACKGVQVIREVIETDKHTWTSVITAPAGTTWTCRASHITTWYPPPATDVSSGTHKRDVPATMVLRDDGGLVATVTQMVQTATSTSFTRPPYDPEMLAHLQSTFNHVCRGRKHNGVHVIDLDDYFGYFNVTTKRKDSDYAKDVEAKFRAHDINQDGLLTIEEVQLRCGSDGCM
ncbi:hypothetical protein A1O7_10063 [Cladophialophora yegresii CBS 114405]|uniref:EF-hand domain-containing protein n=1 Tax=Cladophialophora yegresii CBS 114405 TaxID=1182544 RepID=W9VGG3_9EURO|nr:uncharacterized protein A1O7_10063 [Cladophialophora yegresii CBS 114405]EXJ54722.1 hypothetical protein A1O7_10063 [Cladophialophora yegresii CBS 114405]